MSSFPLPADSRWTSPTPDGNTVDIRRAYMRHMLSLTAPKANDGDDAPPRKIVHLITAGGERDGGGIRADVIGAFDPFIGGKFERSASADPADELSSIDTFLDDCKRDRVNSVRFKFWTRDGEPGKSLQMGPIVSVALDVPRQVTAAERSRLEIDNEHKLRLKMMETAQQQTSESFKFLIATAEELRSQLKVERANTDSLLARVSVAEDGRREADKKVAALQATVSGIQQSPMSNIVRMLEIFTDGSGGTAIAIPAIITALQAIADGDLKRAAQTFGEETAKYKEFLSVAMPMIGEANGKT